MDNMITSPIVHRATDFVHYAFEDPLGALECEGMGPIHAALVPHLKSWTANNEHEERSIMLISPVGSINYNLTTKDSDLDMKVIYSPSLEDLYYSRYPKFSITTSEFDCELHPVHHFVKYALKGNINFFEPVFSKLALCAYPEFLNLLRDLVQMNIKQTILSTYYTARNLHQQVEKIYLKDGERGDWGKKASSSLRCLTFIIELLDSGELTASTLQPTLFRDPIMRLKTGMPPYDTYKSVSEGVLIEVLDTVTGMIMSKVDHNDKPTMSEQVMDFDKTHLPEWDEKKRSLDMLIMNHIRNTGSC
jgi:hypothetical protein